MIEIENVYPIENAGALVAKCDVRIVPWKLTLRDVKIFEKGANRWIAMPSREYTDDTGVKKYVEMIGWDNETIKNRFRDQVMEVVNAYMAANPELKVEDVIKEDAELPF